MVIISPVLLGVATIFTIIRVIVRSPNRFDLWGWDDSVLVLAWVRLQCGHFIISHTYLTTEKATGLPIAIIHIFCKFLVDLRTF